MITLRTRLFIALASLAVAVLGRCVHYEGLG